LELGLNGLSLGSDTSSTYSTMFAGRTIPRKSALCFTVAALHITPCPNGRSKYFYSTGLV